MPIQIPAAATVKAFLTSRKFLIPAGIILLFIAVAFGVSRHLDNQTDERIASAVQNVNLDATNKTLETNNRVQIKNAEVDAKAIEKRVRTAKDYTNVRNDVEAAPVTVREAPVPPLLIDTINELDRLRQDRDRDAGGVSGSEVP